MTTNDTPIIMIKHQVHTTTPVTGDNTLVDDTSALVDDTVALVGGPNSSIGNNSMAMDDKIPRVIIKRSR